MLRATPSSRIRVLSLLVLGCWLPLGASTGHAQDNDRQKELQETEGSLPLEWVQALEWRSIGPANMGGRMIDLAVHPEDPATYWVASAGGGLLKTTNMGVSFEHLFQDQAVASVGAIAVSPVDPDLLWIGTGEPNPRNSVSWGDGVYRSEDGGQTWQHMGLSETFQIGAVVAHPTDRDIAYVSALGRLWGPNDERGLFKTSDGGKTWEKVLFVDENTGSIDVILKPDDPNTLIAATYERSRDGYDTNDPAQKWGAGSGLWKSTDGGATWEKLSSGLPSVRWGRVGLDWYQGDANVVYAVIETERITQLAENAAFFGISGTDGDEVGVRVRSLEEDSPATDAELEEGDLLVTYDGELLTTWSGLQRSLRMRKAGQTATFGVLRDKQPISVVVTFGAYPSESEDEDEIPPTYPPAGPFSSGLGGQVQNVQDLQGDEGHEFGGVYRSDDAGDTWERINSLNPRPMYYSQIRVDPSDEMNIYVLGTLLYRSSDGGKTFTSDGAGREVHVDHHSLWIDPSNGKHIILGNDGGLYVTWDRMETWDHHNHMAMGQFYAVETDVREDYRVYGGLQDNGTWGAPVGVGGRGPINSDWFRVGGGDGFVVRVDPTNPDLVYYESQNGGLGRLDLETGAGGYFRPRGERGVSYRFNWRTPFLLSDHNSGIYYAAGNHVFRSLSKGDNLRRISPEISFTDRGAATALAESPREPDMLFVGTDDGALWSTEDGGVTWTDLFQLNVHEDAELEGEGDAPAIGAISGHMLAAELLGAAELQPTPGQGASFVNSDDPVGGLWVAVSPSPDVSAPDLRLRLVLGADGKVTGMVDSVLGNGDIREGSFELQSGELRLRGIVGGIGYTVLGTLTDGRLEARMTGGAGLLDLAFVAQRKTDAEGTAVVVADAEPAVETEAVASVTTSEDEATETVAETEQESPKAKKPKFIKDTIDQLLPGRFHVSSLVASRHRKDRVYVTFDGHRSDNDLPHVYVSEDAGKSWESLRSNLPDAVGSVRVIVEDTLEQDLLFLGSEFGAFVSVDRGESWTRLNNNLPTVSIHDYSINVASGEIVAGTHGRSLWVLDMSVLREMGKDVLRADAHLFTPGRVSTPERTQERGSTLRRFEGEARPRGMAVTYSLGRKARDVEIFVEDSAGARFADLSASFGDELLNKGLHRTQWNLRRSGGENGGRRRGRTRGASTGSFTLVLVVDGETQRMPFTID
ncbi:MAG: photosystem II stability/assembly factor-like uncharacterized protein [Planctomycetota bacterium]|jgi:photosystem II stability/assembly factor-like uncharacterized protein